jgi:uncharacterized protein YndB with AHSA1/START domain
MRLQHTLTRVVSISATAATVWRFLSETATFSAWWGVGSRVDARPGGELRIVYPNGVVALGEVVESDVSRRIVFTYGYEDPAKPVPAGGSRVTVTLAESSAGTELRLVHELADAGARDMHVPGWRYQLAVLANLAANAQHAGIAERIDRWFAAWNGTASFDDVHPDVTFRDPYACIAGRDDLAAHLVAVRMHLPMTLARTGEPRQCQGRAMCDWAATAPDGSVRARGTNVFELAPDGRIVAVTGLWNP